MILVSFSLSPINVKSLHPGGWGTFIAHYSKRAAQMGNLISNNVLTYWLVFHKESIYMHCFKKFFALRVNFMVQVG